MVNGESWQELKRENENVFPSVRHYFTSLDHTKINLAMGKYCFYYTADVTNMGIAGGKIFDFSIR